MSTDELYKRALKNIVNLVEWSHVNIKALSMFLETSEDGWVGIVNGRSMLSLYQCEKLSNLFDVRLHDLFEEDAVYTSIDMSGLEAGELKALASINKLAMNLEEMDSWLNE